MRPGDRGAPAILIVDDDDYVHAAVRAVLRRLTANVTRAATVAEALATAAAAPPDLAIIDVGLPDGDGYDLAAALKSGASGRTKVLILTGHAPDPSAAQASHVDAVVAKPFRLHDFVDTVERLLAEATPVVRRH
jgi:two-component system, OmpR family, catabolic regulation response regulator CreB